MVSVAATSVVVVEIVNVTETVSMTVDVDRIVVSWTTTVAIEVVDSVDVAVMAAATVVVAIPPTLVMVLVAIG